MRVAIIHDRSDVADEIEAVIRETSESGCRVDRADDVLKARDLLRGNFYDLAVVDLTLPVRMGRGDATLVNAEVLLAEIFDTGDVRVPADILGISRDPDVLKTVRTSIGQHLMACLHEETANVWKEDLAAKIRYVQAAGRARRLVANSQFDIELLVVTALDVEAAPYHRLFETSASDEYRDAHQFDFVDRTGETRRGILFSVGGSGQAPTGSATQGLLSQFRPRLAMMSGFCGGVSGRTNLGDAVAFKSSAAWDYGKWEDVPGSTPIFKPRPGALNIPVRGVRETIRTMISSYVPDDETIGAVTRVSHDLLSTWRLLQEAAGSGSAVITSSDKLGEITRGDDAIRAVDMESYAFYHACLNTPVQPPDFVCIKAVADHCNGEKDDRLHAACSLISASIVKQIITREHRF